MHGCNRSRNGTVQVRGYRRANGTYVAGYTRSLPRKSSSTTTPTASQGKSRASTCGSAVQTISPAASSSGKTVYVRGYTRSNGTHVAGYFRSPPSSKSGSRSSPAASTHVVNRCICSPSSAVAAGYSSPACPPHWPSHATKGVNVTGHTRPTAKSTLVHVSEKHEMLPPRLTVVKSAQITPVSPPTRSSQRFSSTITRDTQVSKCTKFESTTKVNSGTSCTVKETSVQRSINISASDTTKPTAVSDSPTVKIPAKDTSKQNPDIKPYNAMTTSLRRPSDTAKPILTVMVSDSPAVKAPAEDTSKLNPVSRPCNAVPTALVNVEAKVKQLSLARPKSDNSIKPTDPDSKNIQAKSDVLVFAGIKTQKDCCHTRPRTDKEVAQGSISLLASGSDEFSKVVENFRKAWAREKRPHPEVDSVFKVTNSTLEKKWTTYRSRLIEKDVKELYHGTKLSCKITTTQKLCNIGNCGICGISSIGLDHQYIRNGFQRFGNGFYLAPNSSKCNDYTQRCDGLKAMFLCDVLPGRRYIVQTNRQHLEGPPTGYDSVYGNIGEDLNFEEQVVYKSEAVLPRYIIVYS